MNTSLTCEIRRRRGWTQAEVAEVLGIRNGDLSAAENGRHVVVPPRTIELAVSYLDEHPELMTDRGAELERRRAARVARDEAIVEARASGQSLREVARRFGVSPEWVRKITS